MLADPLTLPSRQANSSLRIYCLQSKDTKAILSKDSFSDCAATIYTAAWVNTIDNLLVPPNQVSPSA